MATETKRLSKYFEAYEDVRAQGLEREPVWLQQLREDGWARFSAKGFPSTHDEDWRFTNLAPLAKTPFRRAAKGEFAVSAAQLEAYRVPGAACQLVFVNGHFAPGLSDLGNLPEGLLVCSLAKAIDCGREGCAPEGIEQHLGRYADMSRDVFTALNTALWEDGAYLRVHRGVALEQPIHLLYVSAGAGSEIATHPRTLIIAEDASQAAIIEDYVSLGTEAAFSNAVTELAAGQNAVISHFLVERENLASFNVSTLRIEQSRSANVDSHSILLGGGLVRNNVHPVLNGEGAECLINGLFVGAGRQHIDNYMLVEHARPLCNSRQFYNGILADHARGVFHGRIVVHKDAQKTDAKQTNRNLLLSDNARIDTKPQLEIYADDVKCTHGATIGQIDDAQLFYLRARGIAETEARNLLLYAFAAECLDRMKESAAREFAGKLIRVRLEELARAVQFAAPAATEKEEAQNWEEVG
ncbi:MAG: Fe-S cluster assembly protein SufD [Terracidiphilus sp.]|jgi:Fe-S cluster assembly protein SufD